MHDLILVEREQPVVSFLIFSLLLSYFLASFPYRRQVALSIVIQDNEGRLALGL